MQNQATIISLLNPINIIEQENKNKTQKNSINNPNQERQISSPINPIKENEIENDKTQLTALPPSDNSCKFPTVKKNGIKELKIEMFLCKKRKYSFQEDINIKAKEDKNYNNKKDVSIINNKNINITNNNKENILSLVAYKTNNYNKSYTLHFKKNKNNKLEFKKNNKNKTKSKTIYDYYQSTTTKTKVKTNYNIKDRKLIYNKEKLIKKLEEQD